MEAKTTALSEILRKSTNIDALSAHQATIFSMIQSLKTEEYLQIIQNDLLLKPFIEFRTNFKSFDYSTVVHLLFKSSVANYKNFLWSNFNTVQSIYRNLCNVPEIFLIIKTVEELEDLCVVFDCAPQAKRTPRDSFGRIKCPLAQDRENLRFLIHEFTHLAMQNTYGNEGKPYSINDDSRCNVFEDLLDELALSKNDDVKNYFPKNVSHAEILPRFLELLVPHETDKHVSVNRIRSLQPLFNFFYKFTVEDIKNKRHIPDMRCVGSKYYLM